MVRVIMHGCNGKMGQVITQLAARDGEVEIVAGIDPFDDGHNAYPVFSSVHDCIVKADVLIDFSTAKAVDVLLDYCKANKLPIVLCTTGLTDQQMDKARALSKEVAVLKSANMSLGINTLFKLLKEATAILAPANFDMEIVEKHHNQKLDAPSGTAIALADSMKQSLDDTYYYKYDRSQERAKRDPKEIGISAVRGGTIVGEHEIFFCGEDEVIEFKHTAYSKSIFAKGAIEAAKFLAGQPAGMYDMSHVIG